MPKKEVGTRTYVLELKDGGERKMTFPANWKLTFGNLLPYLNKQNHPEVKFQVALRIYGDNKEDLRAVMMDVVSFRDMSIGVMEKRTTTQRKGGQLRTEHGSKDVIYEARMTEWVDPDKEDTTGAAQIEALTKHDPEKDGPDF